jgi:predicted esterase
MVRVRHSIVASGILLTCVTGSSHPGQETLPEAPGTEFVAAVNLRERNLKLDGTMFFPSSVRTAHVVIVIVNWGSTQELLFDRRPWRNLAQTVNGALVHVRFTEMLFGQGSRAAGTFWDAGLGFGEGLVTLLNRLGDEASHPELGKAPLVVFGFSAAGNFASSFAAWRPDRVVGFVRYHSPRSASVSAIQAIPALLIVGEKDNPAPASDTPLLWKAGRAAGAPWTIAIEPEADHLMRAAFVTKANSLMIPWISAVIRLRVKEAGQPLQSIDPKVGWLGNLDTLEIAPIETFQGTLANTNWLPDAATANGWRLVMGGIK